MYAQKGVPGVRIPLSPPYADMIVGPHGTKDCEPRQVRKEAAVAVSTFAMGSPAISIFTLFKANLSAVNDIVFSAFICDPVQQ